MSAISFVDPEPPNEPKPRADKKGKCACVIWYDRGVVAVIEHVGLAFWSLAHEPEDFKEFLREELAGKTLRGLLVFSGRVTGTAYDSDYWLDGEWRPATDEEVERVRDGEYVFDPDEWWERAPEETGR